MANRKHSTENSIGASHRDLPMFKNNIAGATLLSLLPYIRQSVCPFVRGGIGFPLRIVDKSFLHQFEVQRICRGKKGRSFAI